MRDMETHLAACCDAPDAFGLGRGTGLTFKAIRERLRDIEQGRGGLTHRPVASRHWVRSRRTAINKLRGLSG